MAAALKRSEEARRQIIADAAHELRTPITLIRGAAEAMLDGIYPLDREGLEGIQGETIQLTRLVEDLQELALIESGSLVLERTQLQAEELARSVVDYFQPQARQDGGARQFSRAPGSRGLEEFGAPYLEIWVRMRKDLKAGWSVRGPGRRLLAAALGHALDFMTWSSLVRQQARSGTQAIMLLEAMVAKSAGARSKR